MATVMDFCILLLTTFPILSFLKLRSILFLLCLSRQFCFQACHQLSRLADFHRIFDGRNAVGKFHLAKIFLFVADFFSQFRRGESFDFCFHFTTAFSTFSLLIVNFVLTGNFPSARARALRAVASGTPPASNRMVPGLITATQYSGAPLPFPMRTSAGLRVMGLSGKILIHTCPSRFMARVTATRAASN